MSSSKDPHAHWWRREGHSPKRFRYLEASGARIRDPQTVERLNALRIPPAWTGVRIAPSPRSRVQAVGRDAKGRLQYLYGAKWAAWCR